MSDTKQHTLTLRLRHGVYENAVMTFHRYGVGGGTAISFTTQDGEPLATATVSMPELMLERDEVAIKDYSENQGMMKSLMDAGIIGEPLSYVPTGFVTVSTHNILVPIVYAS